MRKLLIVCALLLCEMPAHPARLQTQRDEAVTLGTSSLAIAESIVQRGMAVLRCDDGVFGRSERYLLSFDPSTALRLAVCSVLALFDSRDFQVQDARYDILIRCIIIANRAFDLATVR